MTPARRAALERAKARLDRLALYPRPVRTERVRIVVAPWFFRRYGDRVIEPEIKLVFACLLVLMVVADASHGHAGCQRSSSAWR